MILNILNIVGLTFAGGLLNVAFVYRMPWLAVASGFAFGFMLWRMN